MKAHGQEEQIFQDNDLTIIYHASLGPAVKNIVKIYPVVRAELEKALKWEIDFRPSIALIKDNETFQKMAGHRLVVAYALPERELIVIDYSRMMTNPFSLDRIIKHELCHLLLHKKIKRQNLPRWLDEGVAQWVSEGLADIIIENNRVLDSAVISNRLIPLRLIEYQFPQEDSLITLAYAESKSMVEFIVSEYGVKGLLNLIKNLDEGHDFDSAVYKTLTISFDDLEKRWYAGLQKHATWLTFVVNNLYEIIFFLGAVLLVLAFIKAFMKKRAYNEMNEEDSND